MNQNEPKVSIIIPIYNSEDNLEECLNSVLFQSYRNIEVLLIDDGSTDDSGKICDNFCIKDKRFIKVYKRNSGVSASRNKGIELSTGEYILFMDSDDVIERNSIEKLVFQADKVKADIVIFGFCYENKAKNEKVFNHVTETTECEIKTFISKYFCNFLDSEMLNPPWNKLIKSELIKNNNILFNENYSICEDMSFNMLLLTYAKKVALNSQAVYYYRIDNPGSLIRRYHENMFKALAYYYEFGLACLNNQNASQYEHDKFNYFCFKRVMAFIPRIYNQKNYSKAQKRKELEKVFSEDIIQIAILTSDRKLKKRLIRWMIVNKKARLLHFIYECRSRIRN